MTPKEKAQELVNKFRNPFDRNGCIPPNESMFPSTAKQCALIAVNEIMDAPNSKNDYSYKELISEDAPDTSWFWDQFDDFWNDVKDEIEKL